MPETQGVAVLRLVLEHGEDLLARLVEQTLGAHPVDEDEQSVGVVIVDQAAHGAVPLGRGALDDDAVDVLTLQGGVEAGDAQDDRVVALLDEHAVHALPVGHEDADGPADR